MNKRHAAVLLLATAGCLALTFVAYSKPASGILQAQAANADSAPSSYQPFPGEPTDRKPEIYQGSFFYASADTMLAALGVKTTPQDKVYAFPDPALRIGSTIRVYRAQAVTIQDGNASGQIRTWGTTVKDTLAEQHIDLGDKDVVNPPLDSVVPTDGSSVSITIVRVAETEVTINSDIDYATTYVDDASMEKGTTAVQTAGQVGVMQKVYKVRRENGAEVSRTLLSSTVTKQPVTKVVKRGTKVTLYGTGQASWYSAGSMTAAHRTLPMGTKVRVVNTANGASVVVTIADRGPFVAGRIIDLSKDAFSAIASTGSGVVSVRLEVP